MNAKAGPPVATDDTGIPVTSKSIELLKNFVALWI